MSGIDPNGGGALVVPGGGGASLSDATPAALGTAAAGVSTSASRADHVHEAPAAGESALPRLALDGALHHWRLDESSSPFADLGPSPVALVQTTGAREYGRAGVYARYGATMQRAPAANDRADAAISDVTGTGDITLGVTVAAEGGVKRSSGFGVIVALHTGVVWQDTLMLISSDQSVAAYAYRTGVGNRITAYVAINWSVPHRIEAIYRVSTGLTTLYVDGIALAVTDYGLPMGALPYASLGGLVQTIPGGLSSGDLLATDFTVHASALSSAQQIARADIVRRLAMG